jgi:hypothetical protein
MKKNKLKPEYPKNATKPPVCFRLFYMTFIYSSDRKGLKPLRWWGLTGEDEKTAEKYVRENTNPIEPGGVIDAREGSSLSWLARIQK